LSQCDKLSHIETNEGPSGLKNKSGVLLNIILQMNHITVNLNWLLPYVVINLQMIEALQLIDRQDHST